ncbi:SNARE domain-containing [Cryptosporidium sp. chipmunk genotype I]|uniref:SNARE domain-containing n=1 Tax=Cryptosporidium sp. chipmunk genotype I TaxID=1280935 RepID=UPI00351A626F|nr:SNARE domain-containing [Cryptosporidium sp. chipmunk genotype I]
MRSAVLPPFWVDLHVEAQEELIRAKELISILQKTQQKRLICVLKDNTMKSSEIEVDKLTYSICESFKRIEKLAQSISNSSVQGTESLSCSAGSINHNILRKNAEISIANELNPLSQQFRFIQKDYMSELQKNHIQRLDGIQTNYEDFEVRNPKFTKNSYFGFREIIRVKS